jgi:peptidyl-prolyl cis-trans isomerase C
VTRLRAAFREPLVHFLIGGVLLFLFFAVRGEPVDPASRTITISAVQVERLSANWAQTWQRPPTAAEIDGLIRDAIKDEVYVREGLRLGIDQDDPIIRKRIRSKMEYLEGAEIENANPDDMTLQAWLDLYPARYANGAKVSFDQIYLAPQDDSLAKAKAVEVRATLAKGADWRTAGEEIALPMGMELQGRSEIARIFGDEFADTVLAQTPGAWIGPVASGFGFHLVRVSAREAGLKPKFSQVRQRVENDWRAATLKTREKKAYQLLLDSYTIKIAKP